MLISTNTTEEPMTPIFLITGSPGVGKTTIGKALAGRFAKSMHIPVDDIRFMVVSGIQQPGLQWSEGLVEQLEAARASVWDGSPLQMCWIRHYHRRFLGYLQPLGGVSGIADNPTGVQDSALSQPGDGHGPQSGPLRTRRKGRLSRCRYPNRP